jgi:hypothetical protein
VKKRSISHITGTFGDPVVTSPEELGEDRGCLARMAGQQPGSGDCGTIADTPV